MTERTRAAVLALGLLALVAGIVITTVLMINLTSSWATQPHVPGGVAAETDDAPGPVTPAP